MHVGITDLPLPGKTFPAFLAHAQPAILCIWQEAHAGRINKSLSFIRNNFKRQYPFNSEMIENAIIFQNFSHKNSTPINASMTYSHHVSGIILWMRPTNERQRYNVMSSLIGWAHLQNDPWCIFKQTPGYSLQNGPAFRVWPLLLTKIYDHMTSQLDLFYLLFVFIYDLQNVYDQKTARTPSQNWDL